MVIWHSVYWCHPKKALTHHLLWVKKNQETQNQKLFVLWLKSTFCVVPKKLTFATGQIVERGNILLSSKREQKRTSAFFFVVTSKASLTHSWHMFENCQKSPIYYIFCALVPVFCQQNGKKWYIKILRKLGNETF